MDSTTKVIKDSIEVFSSILDASTCALVLVQENGIVAYANNAVFEMFGLIPEAIIGKHLNILLVPTTRQKHQQHFDKFFSIKKTREMGEGDAFPAQHKSGKVIYVTIGLKPVTISGEDYVLATITKAAKLNAATNTLAKATANLEISISDNKRLLEVAQNSSDAVFLLNQEAQINWINKAASSLINQSLPDLADVDIVKLVEQSSLSKDLKSFRVALSRGNAFNGELVVAQLNESPIQVSVSLQPVFETNLLQGFSCTFRDITSRRELEAQMRENNELLETTARIANLGFYSLDIASNNLTWSEEVYNIHELPRNTSINVEDAINYYAPEGRGFISAAVERCINTGESFDLELPFITAIILTANTLLNQYWSEIANKHRSKLKVVNDMPSLLSSLKQDKNWQLVVIIDLPSNIPVMTSIKSIKRFLSSSHYLLVNSSLNLSEDTDSIEQSNPNYISIEFDKANPDSPLKQQCYQQFISIYNWQESLKTNYSLDWSGKSILVAEDNLINQVLFKEMLTHTSVTLHIVGNGQEAVDYLNSNNDVDLVIMDCQMPVMDGFDATKQIRANQNSTFANIKVIAATAHGFDEDIQACFDSGMNEVLVKPFSKTQLIDMIAKNL